MQHKIHFAQRRFQLLGFIQRKNGCASKGRYCECDIKKSKILFAGAIPKASRVCKTAWASVDSFLAFQICVFPMG